MRSCSIITQDDVHKNAKNELYHYVLGILKEWVIYHSLIAHSLLEHETHTLTPTKEAYRWGFPCIFQTFQSLVCESLSSETVHFHAIFRNTTFFSRQHETRQHYIGPNHLKRYKTHAPWSLPSITNFVNLHNAIWLMCFFVCALQCLSL